MISSKLFSRYLIIFLVVILGLLYLSSYNLQSVRDEMRIRAGYRNTYNFSVDYFAANADNWRSYLKDYKGKPGVRYLEVGVFEGSSFVWMLENILTDPSARAIAIDPFFGTSEEVFRKNLVSSGSQDKVTVIKGFSYNELPKLTASSFDIIYVDADHRAKNVYLDAALSWGLLKTGGILIFDDYLLNLHYPVNMQPRTAIDAFLTAFEDEVDVVHRAYQLVVRKKPLRCSMLYCSAVGNYGYVWPERLLYDLTNNKEVSISEKEKSVLENFLRIYAEQRLDKREAMKLIYSNRDMSELNEKLKFFGKVQ